MLDKNNKKVQDDEKSEFGATIINFKNFTRLKYFMKYFMKYFNIYKILEILHLSITHNLLHITEPKYLHRLINIKPPSRTRSSDHLCLSLPPVSTRLKFYLLIAHSATSLPADGTLYQ